MSIFLLLFIPVELNSKFFELTPEKIFEIYDTEKTKHFIALICRTC